MKWWNRIPWSLFFECWVLSQLFHSPLSLSRGSLAPLHMRFLRQDYFAPALCDSHYLDPGGQRGLCGLLPWQLWELLPQKGSTWFCPSGRLWFYPIAFWGQLPNRVTRMFTLESSLILLRSVAGRFQEHQSNHFSCILPFIKCKVYDMRDGLKPNHEKFKCQIEGNELWSKFWRRVGPW